MSPGDPMRVADARRRLAWYLHRARAMPPEELPFRVGEQVRRAQGRRPVATGGAPDPGPRVDTSLAQLVLGWRDQPGVASFWQHQSEAAGRGEVVVFGRPWAVTPQGLPDWDLDPVTGFRWPQDYCFDVPLLPATAEPVEVKYVWELNRLLHLLPVAADAAHRGHLPASRSCREHLRDWVERHPPRRGVVWRSGIELAHRVLVMVLVLELTEPVEGRDPALESSVGVAVAEHVDWIRRFPSRYSSANNHRITELVGLLVAATAYPRLATVEELDGWWSELESVTLLQFHHDGVPAEQATMYAFEVVEWLVVGLRLARRQRRRLSTAVLERIDWAAAFLAAVTDAGGHAVRIGDDDDSRLLTAALPPASLPRAALGLVAAGLGRPVPGVPTGLTTFADGGYTVWRHGSAAEEVLWVLDHAPLGMGHLAAHAHADTLAVFLHLGGRPVLVDAGTYLYHSGGDWRDRLRRTAEHNTLAVGGQDSSQIAGPFSWRRGHRAEGQLVSATASGAHWAVDARHEGYRGRYGVVHRRTLEGLGPGSFRLTDRLEGADERLVVRWSLLLAPGLDAVRTPEGWAVGDGGATLVTVVVPAAWRASMSEEPAWYSPAFGELDQTRRLAIDTELGPGVPLQVEFVLPPEQVHRGNLA
ncbi:Heparinase II/III N-terminus [Friedmanniella luteola]|uniref:Heparinase II/III N-terminus n=1 Tax=Friedmanniella luteola TaxID=546871 RepID=A0A1H1Q0S8_9ACTN|nr:heparinase II/III-family protein [Friedmanniella luteola]SDS16847.1 Heparinase II/III N-terminus [Friedmanniella luteola]